MDHITAIPQHSASLKQFAQRYFAYLSALMQRIDPTTLARFVEELQAARASHATVFVIGNGGSAATASHLATDLAMGSQAGPSTVPVRVMALTDNAACLTAAGNDQGYPEVFVWQLRSLYRPGDTLIVISASGSSPNIVAAAKWVKARGGTVLGLIGFDGGEVKGLCDVAIHIETPKGEYGPVEDLHLVINHIVRAWIQAHPVTGPSQEGAEGISCEHPARRR